MVDRLVVVVYVGHDVDGGNACREGGGGHVGYADGNVFFGGTRIRDRTYIT